MRGVGGRVGSKRLVGKPHMSSAYTLSLPADWASADTA